jgi:hypothetical protein
LTAFDGIGNMDYDKAMMRWIWLARQENERERNNKPALWEDKRAVQREDDERRWCGNQLAQQDNERVAHQSDETTRQRDNDRGGCRETTSWHSKRTGGPKDYQYNFKTCLSLNSQNGGPLHLGVFREIWLTMRGDVSNKW